MTNNIAVAVLNPSVEEVLQRIVKACSETKGRDLVALDVSKISDVTRYFVITTGHSDRQVQGITNKIIEALSQVGIEPDSIEGLDQAHWVLVDLGDIVVHVFYEPTRAYYDLDGLWASAKKIEVADESDRNNHPHAA